MAITKKSKAGRKVTQQGRKRTHFEISGVNSEPIRSRLDRSLSVDEEVVEVGKGDVQAEGSGGFLADHFARLLETSHAQSLPPFPPPPPPLLLPYLDTLRPSEVPAEQPLDIFIDHRDVEKVTDGPASDSSQARIMMHANGTHSSQRHHPPHAPRDKRHHGNDFTPPSSTASNGPMPSHIQVAKPYVFHQAIDGCLYDLGVAQAREDNIRLAGVQWIDNVRRALKLPVRTFDTAVIYYHKFRLSHADNEYSFVDAAGAALFAACKIEDTLKKSRDILCAAHNLKVPSRADHLSSDDPIFEQPSRTIIGLERLMLEASSFDFRNRHPQQLLVKIAKHHGYERHSAITKTAHLISLDLYRTFAPLKQSTAAMAFACLELADRLHGQQKEVIMDGQEYKRWGIERAMVMESLLDLLELYINYQKHTTVGPDFPLDTFLEIRIPLNEEISTRRLPRYTEYVDTSLLHKRADTAGYALPATNGVPPTAPGGLNGRIMPNGRLKASPTSPATPSPSTPGIRQKAGERGKEGTVRFMLNPDREREEKSVTALYAPLLASMRR